MPCTPTRKSQASARSVAPPKTLPFSRAMRRQRQRFERVDGVLEQPRVVAGRAVGLVEFAEMEAGAEGAPAAGEHQHAQRGVGGDALEVTLQRQQVLAVQAVEVARAVQREVARAVAAQRQQRRAARQRHGCSGR